MTRANIVNLLGEGRVAEGLTDQQSELILESLVVTQDSYRKTISGILSCISEADRSAANVALDRIIAGAAMYACLATMGELRENPEAMQ
jgi:hypothetical protein